MMRAEEALGLYPAVLEAWNQLSDLDQRELREEMERLRQLLQKEDEMGRFSGCPFRGCRVKEQEAMQRWPDFQAVWMAVEERERWELVWKITGIREASGKGTLRLGRGGYAVLSELETQNS